MELDYDLWGLNEEKRKVAGVGYNSKFDIVYDTDSYKLWYRILHLCKSNPEKNVICDEWKDYETFEQWYQDNFYTVESEKMDLIKNIYDRENIIFSPECCIFVPHKLTCILCLSEKDKPVGITFHEPTNAYRVTCCMTVDGKKINKRKFGFTTYEEAFRWYKSIKEPYIRKCVETYKAKIPFSLYKLLSEWEV